MDNGLAHVLWMGGSPCSGKSSMAALLCERYDLAYYQCDAHFDAHQQAATSVDHPRLHALGGMTWDAIWMRPVAEQVADELAIYREEFGLIVDDLRALPPDRPVLAEGAALLPELVRPHSGMGVWVVPTPDFQLAQYRQREWIHGILDQCSDPDQAFQNWMARDVGFALKVTAQAAARDLPVITVDGRTSIVANADTAAQHLGLA